ncbi:MAG: flagellin [Verrucomicrobiota bacterium]
MATLAIDSQPSRMVAQQTESLQKIFKRLASGSRLANPEDDAAGVSVNASLVARLSQLQASTDNLQNVSSFAQTTDGYLSTVQQQLSRMSELAQRSTDGTLSSSDLAANNVEFQDLKNQIATVTQDASFDGTPIFQNGSISTALDNGSTASFQTSTTGSPASLGISGLSVDTSSNAQTAITSLTQAVQTLSSRRAEVGADISQINFHIQNTATSTVNTADAQSRVSDLDVAEETTRLSMNSILQQASISTLAQSNQSSKSLLKLLS